jgi:hypothetical protein
MNLLGSGWKQEDAWTGQCSVAHLGDGDGGLRAGLGSGHQVCAVGTEADGRVS